MPRPRLVYTGRVRLQPDLWHIMFVDVSVVPKSGYGESRCGGDRDDGQRNPCFLSKAAVEY
jgi:hypothetical protein